MSIMKSSYAPGFLIHDEGLVIIAVEWDSKQQPPPPPPKKEKGVLQVSGLGKHTCIF